MLTEVCTDVLLSTTALLGQQMKFQANRTYNSCPTEVRTILFEVFMSHIVYLVEGI